ncbi:hypothetical protein X474_11935 [Dethiosulfatarculus sandiegensis]|uniref:Uncharacterized protein n=1 Tax=Dethiosulfatarculus sandiegensis TaxID=1429043 RepID=A0A0D2HTU6_9BACT|nr:hypothetical protein X474_11935 [Dethiosulfatarculus sandiegensis]
MMRTAVEFLSLWGRKKGISLGLNIWFFNCILVGGRRIKGRAPSGNYKNAGFPFLPYCLTRADMGVPGRFIYYKHPIMTNENLFQTMITVFWWT